MTEKILLLSCCAPCSCAVIKKLSEEGKDFSVVFYNPNIRPYEEYCKRKEENERSSIVIDTIGYNQCFLGQISLINFKSIGINPEVKNLLDKCLIDTDDRRSFSNFLVKELPPFKNIKEMCIKFETHFPFPS